MSNLTDTFCKLFSLLSFRASGLIVALALFICFAAAQSSKAATFTVNSTADVQDAAAGDGVCETAAGNRIYTLRAAITEANALAGADIITLPAGIYTTTLDNDREDRNAGSDFDISSDITINGAGRDSTFIQAADRPGIAFERVLHFVNTGTSTVRGVTIRHGRYVYLISNNGAGVSVDRGTNVTLDDVIVRDNTTNLPGGGIAVIAGTLTMINSAVAFNTSGVVNQAFGSIGGAGIYLDTGTVTLDRSLVYRNEAIDNSTDFVIARGGGIFTSAGTLNITDSWILENAATTNVQGGVEGGGIFSRSSLTITRSTVSGNTANNRTGATGGGIHSTGPLTLVNSTISGNLVLNGDNNGGGIRAENTTSISNSTITDNRAGGANSASGVFRSAGTATVRSSIIAANQNNQTIPDIAGTFDPTSAFNLIGNVGTATGFSAANRNQTGSAAARLNPLLDALMDNGGAAPTHRLLSGSPAIDKGNSSGLTIDQRVLPRPAEE